MNVSNSLVFAAAVFCCGFQLPSTAQANMRAPEVTSEESSSSLFAAEALTVLSETLLVECAPTSGWRCEVSAQYKVYSGADLQVELDFIAPGRYDLYVEIADKTQKVSNAVVYEPGLDDRYPTPYLRGMAHLGSDHTLPGMVGHITPTLYRATFAADLVTGENLITVRYTQGLGSTDVKVWHKKAREHLGLLRYEVWPLKEWTASDEFVMKVEIRVARTKPGFWSRRRRTYNTVRCGPQVQENFDKSRYQSEDGSVVYRVDFGFAELPDRLLCWFGPARMIDVQE